MKKLIFCVSFVSTLAFAQSSPQKPKMIYMGAYDSGQAGVSIHKLFDPTEDVVCYLLMPDQAGRKEGVNGGWIYEGNSVGSMSCLKAPLPASASGTTKPVLPDTKIKGKK